MAVKVKVKSLSLLRLLRNHGLQPTRYLEPRNFPGKSTGVGCHFLPQGFFLTQGSNPDLSHCRHMLYHLNHLGSPLWQWFWINIWRVCRRIDCWIILPKFLIQQIWQGPLTCIYNRFPGDAAAGLETSVLESLFQRATCSVARLCPTLCDPMNCSLPVFPVFHHLPEFSQTHVH